MHVYLRKELAFIRLFPVNGSLSFDMLSKKYSSVMLKVSSVNNH